MDSSESYTRRQLLGRSAGVALVPTLSLATGSAAAQEEPYGGWLSDDDSFGGVTQDATGMDTVQVDVGVQGNNGPNAFGPSALLVDPDTTLEWVWTGNGFHNVVSEEDKFGNDVTNEEGFTYEYTFSEDGVHQYYCQPHLSVGMKGVVVVGEDNVETELVEFGGDVGDALNTPAIWTGAAVFGGVTVAGVAAYRELVGGDEGHESAE